MAADKEERDKKGFLMSTRFVMESNHNHSLSSADALKQLAAGEDLLEIFNWYHCLSLSEYHC